MIILNRTDFINEKNLGKLKNMIGEKRYNHSVGVMKESEKLAEKYGCDVDKAAIAGLFHDCAKFTKKSDTLNYIENNNIEINIDDYPNYQLIHPKLGRFAASIEYKIYDKEILDAICYHTTLRENPSLLDKIVYLSDVIEPSRTFPGVEILRKLSYEDLNAAVLKSLNDTLKDLIDKGVYIEIETLKSRNFMLKTVRSNDFDKKINN